MLEMIFENTEGDRRVEPLPEIVSGLTPDALETVVQQFERGGWTFKQLRSE